MVNGAFRSVNNGSAAVFRTLTRTARRVRFAYVFEITMEMFPSAEVYVEVLAPTLTRGSETAPAPMLIDCGSVRDKALLLE